MATLPIELDGPGQVNACCSIESPWQRATQSQLRCKFVAPLKSYGDEQRFATLLTLTVSLECQGTTMRYDETQAVVSRHCLEFGSYS
jgi:hypothetical protein